MDTSAVMVITLQIYRCIDTHAFWIPGMGVATSTILSSDRYQVSIRPDSTEGKESSVGFNPSLYPEMSSTSQMPRTEHMLD